MILYANKNLYRHFHVSSSINAKTMNILFIPISVLSVRCIVCIKIEPPCTTAHQQSEEENAKHLQWMMAKHLIDSSDLSSSIGMCEFPNCITFDCFTYIFFVFAFFLKEKNYSFSTCEHFILADACAINNDKSSLNIRYSALFSKLCWQSVSACGFFFNTNKNIVKNNTLAVLKRLRWIHFKYIISEVVYNNNKSETG